MAYLFPVASPTPSLSVCLSMCVSVCVCECVCEYDVVHVCADTPLRRVDFANMFVSFYGSFLLFDDSPGLHLHFMAFHRPTALTTHKVSSPPPPAPPLPPFPLFASALPTPRHLPARIFPLSAVAFSSRCRAAGLACLALLSR